MTTNKFYNDIISGLDDISFIVPEGDYINFNTACHSPISEVAKETWLSYHEKFGVCSGRGMSDIEFNLEDIVDYTRDLILDGLNLDKKTFSVVFTKNATEALNLATKTISFFVDTKGFNSEYYVSPIAHNSLRLPFIQCANEYSYANGVKDLPFKYSFDNTDYTTHKILGLPVIDNVIGASVWDYYKSSFTNKKYQGSIRPREHIILDACQALPFLFNKNKYIEKNNGFLCGTNLRGVSAIAFSGHKFNAPHLGVLIIRKQYLENINEHAHINLGGGTIQNYKNGKPVLYNDHKVLEAGLLDESSIISFGGWLDFLNRFQFDFYGEVKKLNLVFKTFIRGSVKYEIPIVPQMYNLFKLNNITSIRHKDGEEATRNLYNQLLERNVICRYGTFCCDYAFDTMKGLENPLIRFSMDYSTQLEDLQKLIDVLSDLDS